MFSSLRNSAPIPTLIGPPGRLPNCRLAMAVRLDSVLSISCTVPAIIVDCSAARPWGVCSPNGLRKGAPLAPLIPSTRAASCHTRR